MARKFHFSHFGFTMVPERPGRREGTRLAAGDIVAGGPWQPPSLTPVVAPAASFLHRAWGPRRAAAYPTAALIEAKEEASTCLA